MNRTRAAGTLQQLLAGATGVAVEIRWDSSLDSAHVPGRRAWHLIWADGPTVDAMRAKAEQAAAEVGGIEPEKLVYQRTLQPRAYALAMIRQVRLDRPPLGDFTSIAELDGYLERESYPERGNQLEVELADRLVQRTGGLPARMVAVLADHGLDALATGSAAPAADGGTVVPLRRPAGRNRTVR